MGRLISGTYRLVRYYNLARYVFPLLGLPPRKLRSLVEITSQSPNKSCEKMSRKKNTSTCGFITFGYGMLWHGLKKISAS